MRPDPNYENYDPTFPDQPVVDHYLPMWAKLRAFSSKPAFTWVSDRRGLARSLSYAELNDSAVRISTRLLIPLRRGSRVVVLSPPGLELIEIIFGCQRAGMCAIPILPPDPSSAREDSFHHLTRVISQTRPEVAIAPMNYITSLKNSIPIGNNTKLATLLHNLKWVSSENLKTPEKHPKNPVPNNPDSVNYEGCRPEEVYLIQYTSGATGIPKPVLVTAGAAAHNVRAARRAYDLGPGSVIASWLPQYHDCGLMFLLLTIVSGATSVLTSPLEFLNRPILWLEMVSDYSATCSPVPSFALSLTIKRGGNRTSKRDAPIKLSSLRNLIIINEPIYRDIVEEFVRVFGRFGLDPGAVSPSYGLAENCTFVSTAWRPSTLANGTSGSFPNIPTYNRLLPSARLGPDHDNDADMNIVVVNEETSLPVDDGVEGEIWVSSPSNASGYLGHPNLTREVFLARLRGRVGVCFVRTGDRGVVVSRDRSRYLFVTGRCSDVIKLVRGTNDQKPVTVHPHYIETAVYKSFPRLLRGGCIAAFGNSRNTVAVVAELQKTIGEGDEETLKRVCEVVRKAVMDAEGVEVGLVVLVESGSVPKTTSGKVQRWAAREELSAGRMRVVAAVEFGSGVEAEGGGGGGRRVGIVASPMEEEVAYSFSSTKQPRTRLLSSL